MRVAIGQDSHRINYDNTEKKLILAGVEFEENFSILANSDGDVVMHAITNAVSGVTCKNILGKVSDDMCKSGITDSEEYLKEALKYLDGRILHLSISIECKVPKISPKIEEMRKKYWDATHNCYAYVIGERQEVMRCSDDGEPGGTAGKPMLDVLLGAIDYNPNGYSDWVEKHTMLSRLLPFIEPRVNLVELAPKGTGKSYLFGRVGKYGWLVSGGTLSRAKMFFDIAKKQPGLVATSEFVALDEIQSIEFPDPSEMQGALKAYMESGEATFGDKRVVGSAGIILLGNIPLDDMDISKDMFQSLPSVFHESALLDRFHGFIQGRNIPRMNENLKINSWALNTEYFSEIMHLMRSQSECLLYRGVVEDLIEYPVGADTRDTEAILRICTAYLKLFFPHVTRAEMIDVSEFKRYCLRPAVQMRTIIRNQLQIIDPKEYGGKNVAVYSVKKRYEKA